MDLSKPLNTYEFLGSHTKPIFLTLIGLSPRMRLILCSGKNDNSYSLVYVGMVILSIGIISNSVINIF